MASRTRAILIALSLSLVEKLGDEEQTPENAGLDLDHAVMDYYLQILITEAIPVSQPQGDNVTVG